MLIRSPLLIAIVALLAFAVPAQNGSQVDVRLSLGEGRTSFRSGERITLVLTFSSEGGGQSVSTGHSVIDTVLDEVLVSPNEGAFEWKNQYMRGARYTSDAVSLRPLSEGPVRVELPLNHFVRFDAPGRYTVRVRIKRVWRGISGPEGEPLTTNDVSFDVRMMTEQEEAAEVARLSAALDKAKGWQEQTELVTQLSYLAGDAAAAEKVRRFLAPVESGNYQQATIYGLFISRPRGKVLKILEGVFRDSERPVNWDLLGVLTKLRLLEEVPVPAKPAVWGPFIHEEDPDERRIRDRYLREVFDSLPNRRGRSLREAAYLIMQNLRWEPTPADMLEKVREILVAHFDELTVYGQEWLLSARWDKFRDPRLVPSLEKILKNGTRADWATSIMRPHALRRLQELDPERARPFVIAEIRDPASMFNDDTARSLGDEALPEVDDALVRQIGRLGSGAATGAESVQLRLRCLLAARFATKAVYQQLLEIYRTHAAKWQPDPRAFLIAYFLRHEPAEGLRLLEAEVEKIHKDQLGTFLNYVTREHYAAELTPLLEGLLASDDARVAASGAYILSMHGPASSRSKIEARLARWLQRWRGRESELEGAGMKPEHQGEAMLQRELILALRGGKNWKLTDAELNALIAECKTQLCDQYFRPRASDPPR